MVSLCTAHTLRRQQVTAGLLKGKSVSELGLENNHFLI